MKRTTIAAKRILASLICIATGATLGFSAVSTSQMQAIGSICSPFPASKLAAFSPGSDPFRAPLTNQEETAGNALAERERLIASGRKRLESGEATAALALFEEAAEVAPGVETRTWELRAWMELGRINDALSGIDALRRSGLKGPRLDYLYGMAWFHSAEAKRKQGAGSDPRTKINLEDAWRLLLLATNADSDLYRDALRPLAKVSMILGKLDQAYASAQAALEHDPHDARLHHLVGRIWSERHQGLRGDPALALQAREHLTSARASLSQCLRELGSNPKADVGQLLLAYTQLQLAELSLRDRDHERAALELAATIEWYPILIDFARFSDELGYASFSDCLERGTAAFVLRFKAGARDMGQLHWWRGWCAFQAGRLELSERAFADSINAQPNSTNAWYYLARIHDSRSEKRQTVDALIENWDKDPVDLLASLGTDKQYHGNWLAELSRWCRSGGHWLEAALIAEMRAELLPLVPSHWSDLARDLQREAARRSEDPDTREQANNFLLEAVKAWQRAIVLEPLNPAPHAALARLFANELDDLESARSQLAEAIRLLHQKLNEPRNFESKAQMTQQLAEYESELERWDQP